MLNRWVGMGRLVRTPELRTTQGGVDVASFTLACDRDFKSQDGTRLTDWIDVVAWRQLAGFASKYLEKGRMVCVVGRWQMRDYTDREGNKRRAWEVLAENIYFADSRRPEGNASEPPPAGDPQDDGFQPIDDEDGELPF